MFFIQVLQVDFLADFQFTQVYTGLLFLPPDVRSCALAAALVAAGQDGRQLLLALAGDAGDAHDALLRRRLGC